jgi:hypothetical protein
LITSALGFFDVNWKTEVTVVGVAAMCAQMNPANEKERKVITYERKKLSDGKFSERLALYLTVKKFTLARIT